MAFPRKKEEICADHTGLCISPLTLEVTCLCNIQCPAAMESVQCQLCISKNLERAKPLTYWAHSEWISLSSVLSLRN